MIYVSTGGYKNLEASKVSQLFLSHGIKNIELSGGLSSDNMKIDLEKLKKNIFFQIHNYFPPPKNSFVFNLASVNQEISKKSLNHAKKAIDWSCDLGGTTYSFHAGFLIDPKPNELGQKIKKRKLFNRKQAIDTFIKNVNILSKYARSKSISLLIENNVVSHKNLLEFGEDPLLMTTPKECEYVMKKTESNVNLLIDVAHLKVSANSINYNPSQMFETCEPWINGYHLSENDGLADTNSSFTENSWFWKHLKKNIKYYSIEVYNVEIIELISLLNIAKTKLS